MVFSKSFGYAVRSMMYLSSRQGDRTYVQAEEISKELGIPRHFLSKVLKALTKEGILHSNKGPFGGFALNEKSLQMPLLSLVSPTKALPNLHACALKAKHCDGSNPCPLHEQSSAIRKEIIRVLTETNVGQLINKENNQWYETLPALRENDQPASALLTNPVPVS
jgi:Rrf2 family protein